MTFKGLFQSKPQYDSMVVCFFDSEWTENLLEDSNGDAQNSRGMERNGGRILPPTHTSQYNQLAQRAVPIV